MTARWRLIIKGRVQGVGFRWFTLETAKKHGVSGWVRNLFDGSVEAEVQADEKLLKVLVAELKTGNAFAKVESVETKTLPLKEDSAAFEIW